jgi:dTDP-4-amino-4,6-dideoxygalactose transaminase
VSHIPLVDLTAQYQAHKYELDAAFAQAFAGNQFVGGQDHAAFGTEFAAFCGGGHTALCGNGTDALTLAIVEQLGQGDGTGEIITTSHTFIATVEAIVTAGYRPVFAEIDEHTMVLDPASVEAALTKATRGILPVHLYGQMADMDRLAAIANARSLALIEDACQAHGARWNGRHPGAWGGSASYSFYPGKNLGAWGDGGAVFSKDRGLIDRISQRANHGRSDKYEHLFLAVNSRLDGLQAAILRVKLRHLAAWNAARRRAADWYREDLAGLGGVTLPTVAAQAEHVYHLFVVRVRNRDTIFERMKDAGIGVGIHYPIPCHLQPALKNAGYTTPSLPVTERAAREVLSLPLYPEITRAQVSAVAQALRDAVRASA